MDLYFSALGIRSALHELPVSEIRIPRINSEVFLKRHPYLPLAKHRLSDTEWRLWLEVSKDLE